MDNVLDEPVISSSGRKRKIKAETISWNLAKASRYYGEGNALCIVCNHIHTVYDHNNNKVCQASNVTLSSEIKTMKHEMWSYLLLPKKKRLLELSSFAIKQTFNILKIILSMNFNLVNYLYLFKLLILNQYSPTAVWLILLGMCNIKKHKNVQ